MKMMMPFGMAVALLLGGAAVYALTIEQRTYYPACPVIDPERKAVYEQRTSELLADIDRLPVYRNVEPRRSWCAAECAPRDELSVMYHEAVSDPSEDCAAVRGTREWPSVSWVEYHVRTLAKQQRPWPFCTCDYEWTLVERSCATRLTTDSGAAGAGAAEAF